jgi:hypothetical protein
MATMSHSALRSAPPQSRDRDAAADEALPTIDTYRRFARRHRSLIASAMAIGLVLGGIWAWLQPTTYSATASVVLSPVPSYVSATTSQRPPPEVTIDTDAQLVAAGPVVDAVAAAADEDVATVTDRLVVTATPLSRVLHISYTDDSAEDAASAATAAAEALVDVRSAALGALRADQAQLLGLHARELQDRLTSRRRPVAMLPGDDLLSDIGLLRSRLTELEKLRTTPAVVSQRATPPLSPDSSNPEVPLTSGAMLGLLVAVAIAANRDRQRT